MYHSERGFHIVKVHGKHGEGAPLTWSSRPTCRDCSLCVGGRKEPVRVKLVTFDEGRVGRLVDDQVVELDCPSVRAYFEAGAAVGETGEVVPLSRARLRAPIVPRKFFHTAGNFREHHEDLERVSWSHPVNKGIVFFQNVDAIIGPDDPIVYPGK